MSDTLDFLDPDLASQEQQLARRRAYAQALMQQGSGGNAYEPGSGLRQAGSAILGAYLSNRADKRETGIAQQRSAMLASLLNDGGQASPQISNAPMSQAGMEDAQIPGGSPALAAPQVSNTPQGGSDRIRKLATLLALTGGNAKGLLDANSYETPEQKRQGEIAVAQGSRETPEYAGAVANAQRPTPEYQGQVANAQRPSPEYQGQVAAAQQAATLPGQIQLKAAPAAPTQGASPQAFAQQLYIEQLKAYQANPMLYPGGPPQPPAGSGAPPQSAPQSAATPAQLGGDEFLKTLPPTVATQVKALAEGREQFPAGFALKSPYWQQMISAVGQYDPTFDAVNYNARASTRKDFTSGKSAFTMNSLNTALGHAGQLADQIGGTAGHSGFPFATTANAIQNAYSQGMGEPGVPLFKDTAGKLAQELTAVYRNGGGAEKDVVRGLESLSENASAEQKKAILQNAVDLLDSKLDAQAEQYNKGMGTTHEAIKLLNPHAQAAYLKLHGGKSPPVSQAVAPGIGPAPGAVPHAGGSIDDLVNQYKSKP